MPLVIFAVLGVVLLKLAGTVLSLINGSLCYVNEEKLHNFGTKFVNTGHSGPEHRP